MDFYSCFINMQRKTRLAFRLYRTIDMAVMCVLAREPGRAFSFTDIADALGVSYQTAWNATRRLQLNRLVETTPDKGCRLTEAGMELARVDDVQPARPAPQPASGSSPDPDQLY